MNESKKLFIVQGIDGFVVGTHINCSDNGKNTIILDGEEVSGTIPTELLVVDSSKIISYEQLKQQEVQPVANEPQINTPQSEVFMDEPQKKSEVEY